MEETLKLILEKVTQMDSRMSELDSRISQMDSKITQMDARLDSLEKGQLELKENQEKMSLDLARFENKVDEKLSALFDAREVSIHSDEVIIEGVNEVKEDINHLTKAVIRNTADIVDLQSYRKEN